MAKFGLRRWPALPRASKQYGFARCLELHRNFDRQILHAAGLYTAGTDTLFFSKRSHARGTPLMGQISQLTFVRARPQTYDDQRLIQLLHLPGHQGRIGRRRHNSLSSIGDENYAAQGGSTCCFCNSAKAVPRSVNRPAGAA